MAKLTKEIRLQLESAYALLTDETTTLEKIEKIRTLLTGIDPRLDKAIKHNTEVLNHLKAAWNGDVIHLSVHGLAERTPEEKKRKKLLLLFISSWKSLRSEVERIQGYLDNNRQDGRQSAQAALGATVKTGLFAKGPLGMVTLAAVGIVAIGGLLAAKFSTVTIINQGCPPISLPQLPFAIPGVHLPGSPITPGSPGTATLPPLTVTVTGTASAVSATLLGQSGTYYLPAGVRDLLFDGTSLLNRTTQLNLGQSPTHIVTYSCQPDTSPSI